jgi:hypothetical protein
MRFLPNARRPELADRSAVLRQRSEDLLGRSHDLRQQSRFMSRRLARHYSKSNNLLTRSSFQRHEAAMRADIAKD